MLMFSLGTTIMGSHFKRILTFRYFQRSVSGHNYSRRMMYVGVSGTNTEMQVVDLRSDTVTKPTSAMRKAMLEAEVGDDVFQEDPTVLALEKKAASLLGKEAALFVPTGTMGNLLAIMVHCNQRGSEIIVGNMTHIFRSEQGGAAQIAGVHTCTLPNFPDGTFDLNELEKYIRGDDDHEAETALVCVENTHNWCGGKVLPLDWLDKLAEITKIHNIPMHMDGARLFNASIHQNVPPSRIVRDFASVSFCLSKGLGAPVGSLLVGTEKFIKRARRTRKALGGGMRQVGVIAAAGLVALDEDMVNRLTRDHVNALKIAKAVADSQSKNFTVDIKNQHTNIIFVHINANCMNAQEFCQRLSTVTELEKSVLGHKTAAIKAFPGSQTSVRLVTHSDLTDDNVDAAVQKIKYIINELETKC